MQQFGQCVTACTKGAIEIIGGKAKLVSEIYCDGLGACIGNCPQEAITVEQREAVEFDEAAAKEHVAKEKFAAKVHVAKEKKPDDKLPCGCPGMMAMSLRDKSCKAESSGRPVPSQLGHWPVQLKLVSPSAPYFAGADLLLVADCVPFAMGDFHSRFPEKQIIAVGCPKLDDADFYIGKTADIIKIGKPSSLTVIHMEVPCCSGLTRIAKC